MCLCARAWRVLCHVLHALMSICLDYVLMWETGLCTGGQFRGMGTQGKKHGAVQGEAAVFRIKRAFSCQRASLGPKSVPLRAFWNWARSRNVPTMGDGVWCLLGSTEAWRPNVGRVLLSAAEPKPRQGEPNISGKARHNPKP